MNPGTPSGMHVRVRVGREMYAVPIENVLEVAEMGALTAVPGAGAGVLGVRNFHGQVLAVFDLAHVLGVPHDRPPARLVITDKGGSLAGLAVDDVSDVAPLDGALEETHARYLANTTIEEGQLVGVIDVARVFAALGREAE